MAWGYGSAGQRQFLFLKGNQLITPRFVPLLLAGSLLPALAQAQQATAPQVPARPATARPAPAPAEPADDSGEITVTGQREPGAVIGDIPAEVQFKAADIRAIGAGSIAELLAEIAPQTRSGRGRSAGPPAVLINGKRVSGFAEIRNIPPEAILRVDILPEEVALKYGFRADQRVVNFVLRPRFKAFTGDIDVGGPTDGGRFSNETQANFLKLNQGSRISIEAQYNFDSVITEAERRITSPALTRPFDLAGNITAPVVGAEVSPALSALAGRTVTVAAVPAGAASAAPGLAAFVPGANAPNSTDIRPFRSLLPRATAISLNGTLAGSIGKDVAATLTGGYENSRTTAYSGLASANINLPAGNPFSPFNVPVSLNRYAPGALVAEGETSSARLGGVLDGRLGSWRWNLTGNLNRVTTETSNQRSLALAANQARVLAGDASLNPFGAAMLAVPLLVDTARTQSTSGSLDLLLSGSPFSLPAGRVNASVKGQLQRLDLDVNSVRAGLGSSANLGRTQGNFQANVDLPIASARDGVLAALGKLTLNANLALDTLSDFGTLTTWGTGVNWEPVSGWEIITSYTHEQGAPSVTQLGNPLVATPNVRVFDFVTGQAVDITRLDGGNAGLRNDTRNVVKIGLNAKPFEKTDLVFNANFIDSRIRNAIASFPVATAALEAAYPDRFSRDAAGRLTQIDARPVNFDANDRQELRWGFTLTQVLKPTASERAAAEKRIAEFRARAEAARQAGQPLPEVRTPFGTFGGNRPPGQGGFGPPGPGGGTGGGQGGFAAAGRPGGGFGGPGGPGGGNRGGFLDGRVQLAVFHTVTFMNEIRIRPGVPVLDLLNGAAIGNSGGAPRHQIEARAGIGKSGLGARLSLNWQSPTRVLANPDGVAAANDLFFSGLTTLNLRLFADLGQRPGVVQKHPWLRGSRISLAVNNLLNDRINVRDRNGNEPLGYQRDQLDPLGRTVTLTFRKLFF